MPRSFYRMTLTRVPAPAKKRTDPKKMVDSRVVRVQRVRMWKTPAQATPWDKISYIFYGFATASRFFVICG